MPLLQSSIAAVLILAASLAHAADRLPERYYQHRWCDRHGGCAEVILQDRTRCDCLTDTHAIEVDFAPKWAEAVGQALHYASHTGRRAGVVLIVRTEAERRHLARLRALVAHYGLPVDIWEVER